jgi:hypothetical protein
MKRSIRRLIKEMRPRQPQFPQMKRSIRRVIRETRSNHPRKKIQMQDSRLLEMPLW